MQKGNFFIFNWIHFRKYLLMYWYERPFVMKPSYHHEGISSFCEHRVLIKDLDLHCDDSFGVLLDDGALCAGLQLRCHSFIAQSKGYRIYLPYQ